MSELPEVRYGEAKPMSERTWSRVGDEDPDDETMPKTPKSVVALLGFDPLDEET